MKSNVLSHNFYIRSSWESWVKSAQVLGQLEQNISTMHSAFQASKKAKKQHDAMKVIWNSSAKREEDELLPFFSYIFEMVTYLNILKTLPEEIILEGVFPLGENEFIPNRSSKFSVCLRVYNMQGEFLYHPYIIGFIPAIDYLLNYFANPDPDSSITLIIGELVEEVTDSLTEEEKDQVDNNSFRLRGTKN